MSDEIPQHLPRGKACTACRKRKMKCDGNQPTCNQCVRFGRVPECEFVEGPAPSTTRVLEQHISRLQSRIAELEQDDPTLVRLHDPYSQSRSGPSHSTVQQAQANWWAMPEPPPHVAQILMQFFMRHAHKFGFFLDPARFSMSMSNPAGGFPRPPSVLRNTVYLWGIHLSKNAQYTQHESNFLGRALRSVHVALSGAHQQQQNTLYVLQAEILLAYYFFHNDRVLEGRFHASAAVSLAFMSNLHKILSTPLGGAQVGFMAPGQAWLPPPLDSTDEGERIHAWWATFILDKSWVVAFATPSMINENQEPATIIDTPWPLTMDMYRQQPASVRPNFGATTSRFFADVLDIDQTYFALHAKAAALYEKANCMAAYLDQSTAGYETTLSALDASIERFKQSLPPIERSNLPSAETTHYLLLIHSLTQCATINLHRTFVSRSSTSATRCLSAANTIVRVVQSLPVSRLEFVNPIVGVLLVTAGEVLVLGIQSSTGARTRRPSSSSPAMPGKEQFAVALGQLSEAIAGLSPSPFIEKQASKMREALVPM